MNKKYFFVKPFWFEVVVEDVDALLCSQRKKGVIRESYHSAIHHAAFHRPTH